VRPREPSIAITGASTALGAVHPAREPPGRHNPHDMAKSQDAAIKRLAPAVDRSKGEWRLLRARLSTITPQALGRGVLSTVVVVVAAVLAKETWPALLPFAIGGLLAYTIYPVVDRLDRVMPRVLAAALALAAGLAVLVLVVAVVIPPLVAVSIQFFRDLPDSAQLADLRAQLDAYLATLPEGARVLVVGILERVGATARDGISAFLDSIASLIVASVVGIFDTIGLVVGLILLPLWTLSVVRDGGSLRARLASQFAPALRADAMALLTIVHRALGTFLRVQLAAAGAVGVAVYVGLQGVERADIATYQAAIAVAAFMGTAQVIPQLGGLIGALPIGLLALARQDEPAATVALLVVYVVALQLVKMAVGARLGRDLNVRPAIALPAFAVISQIGIVWLLLSAPILVIARNTVAYLRGRLSEPPRPAGVLPGQRTAKRPALAAAATLPPLYRHATDGTRQGRAGGGVSAPRSVSGALPATAAGVVPPSSRPIGATASAPIVIGASPMTVRR
jgi:predicted PurR-regulated permease PerM